MLKSTKCSHLQQLYLLLSSAIALDRIFNFEGYFNSTTKLKKELHNVKSVEYSLLHSGKLQFNDLGNKPAACVNYIKKGLNKFTDYPRCEDDSVSVTPVSECCLKTSQLFSVITFNIFIKRKQKKIS